MNFKFSLNTTKEGNTSSQLFSEILFFNSFLLFRFISLVGDTTSTIPATRRLVFSFWVVHSTTYQIRKNFIEKAFESIIKMGNLYSAVLKNVVAERNDFFKHLRCCPHKVGGIFFIFAKFLRCISDMGELPSKVLTLMSNVITHETYRRNL